MSMKIDRPVKRSRSAAAKATDKANKTRSSKKTFYLNRFTIIESFENFGPNIRTLFDKRQMPCNHVIKFFKDEASMRKDLELYDLGAKEYESAR